MHDLNFVNLVVKSFKVSNLTEKFKNFLNVVVDNGLSFRGSSTINFHFEDFAGTSSSFDPIFMSLNFLQPS